MNLTHMVEFGAKMKLKSVFPTVKPKIHFG